MRKVIRVPGLAQFRWEPGERLWRGRLQLPSGRYASFEITPSTDEHVERPDLADVFRNGYPVADYLRESEREAYLAVSQREVVLYNEYWSEEGPISAEEFADRIRLGSVHLASGGDTFTLCFTDGRKQMFGGHGIGAEFTLDGKFLRASL